MKLKITFKSLPASQKAVQVTKRGSFKYYSNNHRIPKWLYKLL